ncbi:MAG: hypothetical protein KAJ42_14300 [Gemmatimonadetes bacterium]|nr:hypothetical protein [Gemmatimonadota bacterium]
MTIPPIAEGLPSPRGQTIARRIFKKDVVIAVTTLLIIPVAQWADFAIHVEASGGNFTLRARWVDLEGNTYEDTDPTINGTLYVGGTRIKYVVPASEHNGEPLLQVGILSPTASINVQNFEIMGTPN